MLVGNVDRVSTALIGGWAADDEAPDAIVEVIIFVDGRQLAHVPCNRPRVDLKRLGTLGDGCHGFRYQFSSPLSPEAMHRVSVRFSTTGEPLPNGEGAIQLGAQTTQLIPILITALGRSGTTLLMRRLLNSSAIVGGELYPFELRLLSYYATAYNVLTSPADHTHSTHPDALEGTRHSVGSNPFFHKDYRSMFASPDTFDLFFKDLVPREISNLFGKLINNYYKVLGEDQNKSRALFFVEKSNNLHPWPRTFARAAFGTIKEVILLRDPRDLYCSHREYFKSEKSAALNHVRGACSDLVGIRAAATSDMHFVHYEEMLFGDQHTYDELSTFLGAQISSSDQTGRESYLFERHRTSESPSASVGRWRTELPNEERTAIERGCSNFFVTFGYEM